METSGLSRTSHGSNLAQAKRAPQFALFLSLALNVGLILFLAFAWRKPQAIRHDTGQPSQHAQNTDNKRLGARATHVSPWAQLESTDLSAYASNLRTAGCPPKTVRDVLLPLIEAKFENSELPPAEPTNFWASFSERQAAAAARMKQERALQQEKEKMVEDLLGFAWDSEELRQVYAGEAAGTIGFLDYDRAEKFLCLADRFNKQFADADRVHRVDRRASVYQTWRQKVGEVLSAADFEETELRGLVLTFQRTHPNICNAGLSGSELRQLMIFAREICKPLPSALLSGSAELVYQFDSERELQLYDKARALLGDARFLGFLNSFDGMMERTVATLERLNLPRDLALKMFDLRRNAVARAQQIRQFPQRPAEKRAQLAALRQSSVEQLLALPNVETDSPLFRVNEQWLQRISKP